MPKSRMQQRETEKPPALDVALYYRQQNYMELREHMLALQRLLRADSNAEAALDNINEQTRIGVGAELEKHLLALRCALQRRTAVYRDLYAQIESLKMQVQAKDSEIAALRDRFSSFGNDVFRDAMAQARRAAPLCKSEHDVQKLLDGVESAHARANAAFQQHAEAEMADKQAEIMRLRAELGSLRLSAERRPKAD